MATRCPPTNPIVQLQLPSYIAEKIWKEAERLNDNPSNICLSPGCTNDREWLVKSGEEKHRQPYFVECKPSGQILCEKTCALYLSSKVCAHTVAVACHTSTMDKYLSWVQKQKGSMSLSALANLNMPKGAGKNPNSHRKVSHKSSTKLIKAILSEADQLTPRIKVARKSKSTSMDNTQTDFDIPGPSTSYPPPPLCHVSATVGVCWSSSASCVHGLLSVCMLVFFMLQLLQCLMQWSKIKTFGCTLLKGTFQDVMVVESVTSATKMGDQEHHRTIYAFNAKSM